MLTAFRAATTVIFSLLAVAGPAAAAEAPGRLIDGPAGKLWVETRGTAPGRPLLIVNGGPGFDHS